MTYPERAVNACVAAMEKEKVSGTQVQAVLKYEDVDVSKIEPFLSSENYQVRRFVIQIVGRKGNPEKLVARAKIEKDKELLKLILSELGKGGFKEVEGLAFLLRADSQEVREAAIQMFRKADADELFPFLFDKNDETVARVKRYIHEQEE
jgi:hypothetical protein